MAPFDAANDGDKDNILARDKGRYCVRSWLSLFGGNASTQVVDTQVLGTVTVEIQLAPANILMLGTATSALSTSDGVTVAANKTSKMKLGEPE